MDAQAKQQIVERVKQAENILVTVAKDPSVDQLAACIGLTLMLNKMGKHATAVFSGKVPSILEFLQPAKTLETNTDSLRDFIISLDKDKADKLRYKVEDKVVRIFITPYRTSISEKDLVFTQGDFNVEAVLALGIKDRSQIDAAITSHGRILHDASVISINSGHGTVPNVGQINWQDPTASGLCEMIVSISEAFGSGLIDNQIATAFLTGIVAETERFSNPKTSPKVMTISAQLMASGANQQLIATKLQPAPPPPPPPKPVSRAPQPKPTQLSKTVPAKKVEPPKKVEQPQEKDGKLNINHGSVKPGDVREVEIKPGEIRIDEEGNIRTAEELRAKKLAEFKEQSLVTEPVQPPAEEPKIESSSSSAKELEAITPEHLPQASSQTLPPQNQMPKTNATKLPEAAHGEGKTPPAGATLAKPPVTNQYKPHELMDPLSRAPAIGGPFSADTNQSWDDSYNSVPFDPLGSGLQTDGYRGASEKRVEEPGQIDVEKARSLVENVYSTAPQPNAPPQQNTGAAFLEPGLHTPPPANSAAPSLQLPTNGAPQSPPPFPPPPFPPMPPSAK
jgi:hypothetical protein